MEELAKKFLDEILYDNDFVTRWTPFHEKMYGDWVPKVDKVLEKIVPELGIEFFTEDFIQMFCDGMSDDIEDAIERHGCLAELHKVLNDYFEWLGETE